MALLRPFAVELHPESDVTNILQTLDTLEFSNHSRAIKSLGFLPWMAFGLALILQVASGEIDADSDGVNIGHCLVFTDIMARPANSQHQFCLVMNFVAELGIGERLTLRQQGRVGLHEKHRLGGQRIVQFLDVGQIVAPNANHLHRPQCFTCFPPMRNLMAVTTFFV